MLQIEEVAHSYQGPGKNAKIIQALAPLSFRVAEGECVSIVGPSGCGKSTLLRIVAGLLKPSQGKVLFNGKVIDGPQREIGLIFQQANLMPWRTVQENIALPLELSGLDRATQKLRVTEVTNKVQLVGFEQAYPAELSGGMAQRVAIGRALIQNPAALHLDVPLWA